MERTVEVQRKFYRGSEKVEKTRSICKFYVRIATQERQIWNESSLAANGDEMAVKNMEGK